MSEADKHYIAGFFDGEGSIGLYRYRKPNSYHLFISVSNTYLPILEFLQHRFDGYITKIKTKSPKHRQAFIWRASNRSARVFLETITPYLKEKAPQAQTALSFLNLRDNRPSWHLDPNTAKQYKEFSTALSSMKKKTYGN